ncbi:MAG: DMT family transporter, partial [Burkholderiales bacterium]|nr:DMT family transporter [Burkholderiales bacterium]
MTSEVHKPKFPPEFALVFVATLWGLSFILIAISLRSCSPGLLVSIRFTCGALLTATLLGRNLFKLTKTDWIGGFAVGSCMFVSYFLQTVGMQTIPSSISAFLTSLYVPFVPVLQLLVFRKVPSPIVATGIVMAFLGMTLILDPTTLSFQGSFGELITILCAVFCAFEILFISKYA